jgi:predicted CXXCH cytochrome family protein
MNLLSFAIFSFLGFVFQGESAKPDTCVSCHLELGDDFAVPVHQMKGDVHEKRGFSCVNCHGGDATQTDKDLAMDPRRGFIGTPKPAAVASFCGKCHSDAQFMRNYNPSLRVDQAAEYGTSVHGKRAVMGDTRVATCTSCHGNHGIKGVKDPNAPVYPTKVSQTCGACHADQTRMESYHIPTDQLQKYERSAHAEALMKRGDLSAPTCNDCHGNHGATPPGITSIANVCGTCHSIQSELFRKSPHKSVFEAMSAGECLVCHSNHEVIHTSDQMLGVGVQSVCAMCHSQGETGYDAARTMRQGIDELATQLKQSEEVLQRAERAGMEVSHPKFELSEGRGKLINARVVIHSASPDELAEVVKSGLDVAGKTHQAGVDALDELTFRRKGLAVSLVIILIAVFAIYLKIHQIETVRRP